MKNVKTPQRQGFGRSGSGDDSFGQGTRLSHCKKGQRCCLSTIDGDSEFRLRLMEMGLTKGARVTVIKSAPLNDPVELRVKGYNLALRKGQLRNILVDQGAEEK